MLFKLYMERMHLQNSTKETDVPIWFTLYNRGVVVMDRGIALISKTHKLLSMKNRQSWRKYLSDIGNDVIWHWKWSIMPAGVENNVLYIKESIC